MSQRMNSIDLERRVLNVSQKDLCAQARVAPSTYVRIKQGRVSPTERTLERLSNALAIIRHRNEPGDRP